MGSVASCCELSKEKKDAVPASPSKPATPKSERHSSKRSGSKEALSRKTSKDAGTKASVGKPSISTESPESEASTQAPSSCNSKRSKSKTLSTSPKSCKSDNDDKPSGSASPSGQTSNTPKQEKARSKSKEKLDSEDKAPTSACPDDNEQTPSPTASRRGSKEIADTPSRRASNESVQSASRKQKGSPKAASRKGSKEPAPPKGSKDSANYASEKSSKSKASTEDGGREQSTPQNAEKQPPDASGSPPNQEGNQDSAEASEKSEEQLRKVESREELKFVSEKMLAAKVVECLGFDADSASRAADSAASAARQSVHVTTSRAVVKNGAKSAECFSFNFPINFSQAEALRGNYTRYGTSRPLDDRTALALIKQFEQRYQQMYPCAVADINLPAKGHIRIVGDTHGQLQDVLLMFHLYGPPTAENVYVFNGDVADRGPNACEIYFLLFAYFMADPSSLVFNRGNHESEEMNSMEASCGGGFHDEVLFKYDLEIYRAFVAMMRVLPLCAIIGKKIFVVHGGLPGTENLTVDFIRSIKHMEFTLPPAKSADIHMQVWNDLLWSDPMDHNGHKENPRGDGVLFGPDVTKNFLANNALELLVRSHQTPKEKRGYQKQKGNLCVTIFSASNYMDHNGNKGAVMDFDVKAFPKFDIQEHYAPTLKIIGEMAEKGKKDWAEAGVALMERGKDQFVAKSRERELNKLMLLIVEQKPEIWQQFLQKHNGNAEVDFKDWSGTLSDVLGEDWHFEMAWQSWRLGETNGLVDFLAFLKRFSVVVSHDAVTYFKCKSIVLVYERLLDSLHTLKDVIKTFDVNGDGRVNAKEMQAAMKKFNLGLTPSQLASLVHAIFLNTSEYDGDGSPSLPIDEFLGRFTLVYKHAHSVIAVDTLRTKEEQMVVEVMSKIGHCIATEPMDVQAPSKLCKNGSTSSLLSKESAAGVQIACKLDRLFESSDSNSDGELSIDEFVSGLRRVQSIREVKLSNGKGLDETMLRKVARHLDRTGDGSISLLELLEGFTFDDGGDGELADALADHVLTIICRHRHAIRAGARCFDTQHTGCVTRDEFGKVLVALDHALAIPVSRTSSPFNTASRRSSKQLAVRNEHLLESQIEHLCDALAEQDKKGGGVSVAYEDFFDTFEIVDSENPSLGVKLGRRKDDGCPFGSASNTAK